MDINQIRLEIDRLDNELLKIFNQRASLAMRIGEIKKEQGLPVYDPCRERLIFDKVKEANPGPLEDEAIIRLFETVIDESRRLEDQNQD